MHNNYAVAGSQRWLQVAVDNKPELLTRGLSVPGMALVEWLSPIRSTGFKEFRDQEALKLLMLDPLPKRQLSEFWPAGGPVWDGLARTAAGSVLLVEAKANVPELASPATRATAGSLKRICGSLLEVQAFLAPKSGADWSRTFFQYANRLAFLYLLRELNGIDAHLVHVLFLNAQDVQGPQHEREWADALALIYGALELPRRNPLAPFVHHVFIDVGDLLPFASSRESRKAISI
jgi:hypothetical protein